MRCLSTSSIDIGACGCVLCHPYKLLDARLVDDPLTISCTPNSIVFLISMLMLAALRLFLRDYALSLLHRQHGVNCLQVILPRSLRPVSKHAIQCQTTASLATLPRAIDCSLLLCPLLCVQLKEHRYSEFCLSKRPAARRILPLQSLPYLHLLPWLIHLTTDLSNARR